MASDKHAPHLPVRGLETTPFCAGVCVYREGKEHRMESALWETARLHGNRGGGKVFEFEFRATFVIPPTHRVYYSRIIIEREKTRVLRKWLVKIKKNIKDKRVILQSRSFYFSPSH